MPPKGRGTQSPVVVGDVSLSALTSTSSSSAPTTSDPWAQYLVIQGRPSPPATTTRSVVGPTKTKFKEQERKLHALEVRLASMEATSSTFQQDTQKNLALLNTNIRQQGHDMQNRLHSIGLRFDEHQKEVAQQLH